MARTTVQYSGPAAAAIASAAIGILTLAVSTLAAELNGGFKTWLLDLGKAWIPNAAGIGPYSGKETMMLILWLASWIGLHFVLRRRNVNLNRWLIAGSIGLAVAVLLVWPPVWHLFE